MKYNTVDNVMKNVEILVKNIQWCEKCNNYRGSVEEKYNGKVPVYCACRLEEGQIRQNPCMNCPNGDKFCWLPGCDFKTPNGEMVHYCVVYAPRLKYN